MQETRTFHDGFQFLQPTRRFYAISAEKLAELRSCVRGTSAREVLASIERGPYWEVPVSGEANG